MLDLAFWFWILQRFNPNMGLVHPLQATHRHTHIQERSILYCNAVFTTGKQSGRRWHECTNRRPTLAGQQSKVKLALESVTSTNKLPYLQISIRSQLKQHCNGNSATMATLACVIIFMSRCTWFYLTEGLIRLQWRTQTVQWCVRCNDSSSDWCLSHCNSTWNIPPVHTAESLQFIKFVKINRAQV